MNVEAGVGMAVESAPGAGLRLRLLGPLAVWTADGRAVPLPPSRKVRALLAYLALAGRGVGRAALCELLWDVPSDPRGELRWCLSKLRGVLDTPARQRVAAVDDGVALDLADCDVDALAVGAALQRGIAGLDAAALAALAARFDAGASFCEGLELPRSPVFDGWLVAQRRRLRAGLAALLEHWALALPEGSDAVVPVLERWAAAAPFDRRAHERLLDALAAGGRLREGDAHLAAVERLFDAEQQDWAPIGLAWRAARQRHARGAVAVATPAAAPPAAPAPAPARRASLVVMPFAERGGGAPLRGGIGDGLAHDITTRLAKLRSLFVIASGTAFVLDERRVGAEDAGRRLDVDYVVSGALRPAAPGRLVVSAQLVETRSARVLWADEFAGTRDDTFAVLDDIGNRIVAAAASQIEVAERNRAILKPPHSLDAWEAYHRGLWHAMRFDRADNEQARHFFQTAVRLDPTFARPWAALSFTHFQDAFQHWRERGPATEQAHRFAAQALECDERDPAAHWAFGRALWLQGRHGEGLGALDTAVELSPNFAHGHYMRAFVNAQAGDAPRALADADHARALSPFDPLAFGMLGTRAVALMSLGRHDEAADWALKAAARPNAHVHIQAVAMHCLALAGRLDEARRFAAAIARAQPGYATADFLAAFRFGPDREALVHEAARRLGAR
jgi:DNA-binding SARP family transcriptional activator/TolB-like protein